MIHRFLPGPDIKRCSVQVVMNCHFWKLIHKMSTLIYTLISIRMMRFLLTCLVAKQEFKCSKTPLILGLKESNISTQQLDPKITPTKPTWEKPNAKTGASASTVVGSNNSILTSWKKTCKTSFNTLKWKRVTSPCGTLSKSPETIETKNLRRKLCRRWS